VTYQIVARQNRIKNISYAIKSQNKNCRNKKSSSPDSTTYIPTCTQGKKAKLHLLQENFEVQGEYREVRRSTEKYKGSTKGVQMKYVVLKSRFSPLHPPHHFFPYFQHHYS
jgi:hypothetical protein